MTEAFSDFVVGHGELWCAQLLNATLQRKGVSCAFMDTRQVWPQGPCSCPDATDLLIALLQDSVVHGRLSHAATCVLHRLIVWWVQAMPRLLTRSFLGAKCWARESGR